MSSIASDAVDSHSEELNSGNAKPYLYLSRKLDFLLLGGIAILLWIPVYFLQDQIPLAKSLGLALPGLGLMLVFWVNYPHFMASYKLAYTQGERFVTENQFQLVYVPLTMILAIMLGYVYWDASIADSSIVIGVNTMFETVGLDTRLGLYPNLSAEIMGLFVLLMYFTVGWHYSKQTFGCMMVYAKLDGYPLSVLHRNLIRYGLLSTWWLSWLYGNASVGTYDFYGLTIHRLGLPYVLFQISYVIVGIMFVVMLALFAHKFLVEKQRPSVNFLVPMVALMIWHVPLFGNPQYFYIVAFFHSLQYFPFVAKVETGRYQKHNRRYPIGRLLLFFGMMVVLGYLSFDYVPNLLDSTVNARTTIGISYFFIAFMTFINIHHYFIDNVLWRFKNKDVKELLFDQLAVDSKR